MAGPDIRVRLSAEGVQEIVDALRRIREESAKTGRGASAGFLDFSRGLSGVKQLLGAAGITLGIVEAVHGLRDLLAGASEVSRELGDMKDQLGGDGAGVLKLAAAAKITETELAPMKTAIASTSRATADFARGADGPAVRALKNLGFQARDFKGKNLADQFTLIATRIGRYENAQVRANLAGDVFGKKVGLELVPVMRFLASQSEDTQRALGQMFSDGVIQTIGRMRQQSALLGLEIKGIAAELIAGAGPRVTDEFKRLGDTIVTLGPALRFVGDVAGRIFQFMLIGLSLITGGFKLAGIGAASFAAIVVEDIGAAWQIATATMRGNFAEAERLEKLHEQKLDAIRKHAGDDAKKAAEEIRRAVVAPFTTPQQQLGPEFRPEDRAQADADAARHRLELARTESEARLALARATAKAEQSITDDAFQRSTVSVRDHFTERRRILDEEFAAERAVLLKRIELAKQDPDAQKGAIEAAKARADLRVLETTHLQQAIELVHQERDALERNATEELSFIRKEQEARGQAHESRLAEFASEERQFEELLRREGRTAEDVARRVAEFRAALISSEFADVTRESFDRSVTQFERERAAIQDEIDAGVKSEVFGQREILDLTRQHVEELRQRLTIARAFAEATGDQNRLAQLDEAEAALRRMELQLEQLDHVGRIVGATFLDAAQHGLAEFFSRGIRESKNLLDAVRNMAAGILQAVDDLVSQLLAKRIVGAIAGLFGFGGGSSASAAAPQSLIEPRAARGGLITARGVSRGRGGRAAGGSAPTTQGLARGGLVEPGSAAARPASGGSAPVSARVASVKPAPDPAARLEGESEADHLVRLMDGLGRGPAATDPSATLTVEGTEPAAPRGVVARVVSFLRGVAGRPSPRPSAAAAPLGEATAAPQALARGGLVLDPAAPRTAASTTEAQQAKPLPEPEAAPASPEGDRARAPRPEAPARPTEEVYRPSEVGRADAPAAGAPGPGTVADSVVVRREGEAHRVTGGAIVPDNGAPDAAAAGVTPAVLQGVEPAAAGDSGARAQGERPAGPAPAWHTTHVPYVVPDPEQPRVVVMQAAASGVSRTPVVPVSPAEFSPAEPEAAAPRARSPRTIFGRLAAWIRPRGSEVIPPAAAAQTGTQRTQAVTESGGQDATAAPGLARAAGGQDATSTAWERHRLPHRTGVPLEDVLAADAAERDAAAAAGQTVGSMGLPAQPGAVAEPDGGARPARDVLRGGGALGSGSDAPSVANPAAPGFARGGAVDEPATPARRTARRSTSETTTEDTRRRRTVRRRESTVVRMAREFARGFARGGWVRGPGSSTSDSVHTAVPPGTFIVRASQAQRTENRRFLETLASRPGRPTYSKLVPVRLSAGEFRLDPEVVRQPGVHSVLERINAGDTDALEAVYRGSLTPQLVPPHRRYAEGGLVGDTGGRAARAGGPSPLLGHILLEHTDDFDARVLRAMESPEGERIQIRTHRRNKRAVNGN